MSRFCQTIAGEPVSAVASACPQGMYVSIGEHHGFVHLSEDQTHLVLSAKPPGHVPTWADAEATHMAHRD